MKRKSAQALTSELFRLLDKPGPEASGQVYDLLREYDYDPDMIAEIAMQLKTISDKALTGKMLT